MKIDVVLKKLKGMDRKTALDFLQARIEKCREKEIIDSPVRMSVKARISDVIVYRMLLNENLHEINFAGGLAEGYYTFFFDITQEVFLMLIDEIKKIKI